MNAVMLVAVMGIGAGTSPDMANEARTVDRPLSSPSAWMLDWFEKDGKREKRRGELTLDKNGCGVLHIFPYRDWIILASRIDGGSEYGSFELDIRWEGAVPGKATLYGIYWVRNNRLWLCFSIEDLGHRSGFTTKPDDYQTLLVFRRLK